MPLPHRRTVFTGWFPIEPNTEYLVRGGAWMATNTAGSGQIILYVQTGEADAAGVKTLLTTTTVKNVTDTGFGSGSFAEVSFTSDANRAVGAVQDQPCRRWDCRR